MAGRKAAPDQLEDEKWGPPVHAGGWSHQPLRHVWLLMVVTMETAAQFRVEERWQDRGRCAVCGCTAHLGEAGWVCCCVCTACCGRLAVLSGFALLAVAWGLAALSGPTLPKVWRGELEVGCVPYCALLVAPRVG